MVRRSPHGLFRIWNREKNMSQSRKKQKDNRLQSKLQACELGLTAVKPSPSSLVGGLNETKNKVKRISYEASRYNREGMKHQQGIEINTYDKRKVFRSDGSLMGIRVSAQVYNRLPKNKRFVLGNRYYFGRIER